MTKWREFTAKLPQNRIFGNWPFHNLHIFTTRVRSFYVPPEIGTNFALSVFSLPSAHACRYSTLAYRVYLRGPGGDVREGDSSYDSRLSSGGNK
jgi:hypothetical protein